MNAALRLTAAWLAGCTVSAAVLPAAHAQAALPAYTIAEIDAFDPEGFQEFAKKNAAGVRAAGGRFLALRGRIAGGDGTAPKAIALIAWESLEQATAYFESPTFRELVPLRDRSAKVRLFHVEGLAP